MVDLQRKRNLSILSSEKAVEIPENQAAVVPHINDHVTARYDRKFYVSKALEIDDSDANISFYEYYNSINKFNFLRAQKER